MVKQLIIVFFIFLTASCASKRHINFNHYSLPIKHDRPIKNVGIALVLGGGGSRGVAHIGVLEVLEKNNIPIDLIVGTSAGSIVGSLYADKLSYKQVKNKVMELNKWDLLDLSFTNILHLGYTTSGIIEGKKLQKFLEKHLDAKKFEEMKIPTVFVATEVLHQKPYKFNKGPIVPAIMASSAIPPIIPPVEVYNELLMDGGIVEPVPVRIAKLYNPKLIIAVDISETPPLKEVPKNTLDLVYWSLWLSYAELAHIQASSADITIRPPLEGFGMFSDDNLEKLYNLGVQAAEQKIDLIKREMQNRKIKPRNTKVKSV